MKVCFLAALLILGVSLPQAYARDSANGYEIGGIALGSQFNPNSPAFTEFGREVLKNEGLLVRKNVRGEELAVHFKDQVVTMITLTKYYNKHKDLVASFKRDLEAMQNVLGMPTRAAIFDSNIANVNIDHNGRRAWGDGPGLSCATWYFKGANERAGLKISRYDTGGGVNAWCVTPDFGQNAIGIYAFDISAGGYGLAISASLQIVK